VEAVGQALRVVGNDPAGGRRAVALGFRGRAGGAGGTVRRRRDEGRFGSGGRRGGGGGGSAVGLGGGRIDLDQHGADRDRIALTTVDRRDHTGRRRGDLDVDFVGGDIDQRLAFIDPGADLFSPLDDRAFGHRLPHFREGHLYQ
jgi:hypothetical protein